LTISSSVTRFIEKEAVAGDATIMGNTWKYVNKSGGPERRFNDNPPYSPSALIPNTS